MVVRIYGLSKINLTPTVRSGVCNHPKASDKASRPQGDLLFLMWVEYDAY